MVYSGSGDRTDPAQFGSDSAVAVDISAAVAGEGIND
jgi:hypothetical protein